MSEILPAVPEQNEVSTDVLSEGSQRYRDTSRASNTMRSYQSDLKDFSKWCQAQGRQFLPASASTVADYLTHLADEMEYKVSTLQRRMSAISQLHKAQNYASPTQDQAVKDVMKGIRRTKGTRQEGKSPLRLDDLKRMLGVLPGDLLGTRDRALLLLGFAKAFRRSELAGLDREDVEFTREGLVIRLKHSKTNQEGEEEVYGVPYGSTPTTCPVRALEDWLQAAGITSGPIFRPLDRHGNIKPRRLSSKGVARIVKRWAESAGLDPDEYGGHSLRSGFATDAASKGVSERAIMRQTGHKSLTMVRRYIREGSLFEDNAAAQIGL